MTNIMNISETFVKNLILILKFYLVQVTIKLWIKLPSYFLSIDFRKLRRNAFYRNNVKLVEIEV